ncbi:MAG: hypothetical protein KKC77_19680 [Proteobacteria bacterium]|nr:hypothetical protein [Pseudomonadota bacterium]
MMHVLFRYGILKKLDFKFSMIKPEETVGRCTSFGTKDSSFMLGGASIEINLSKFKDLEDDEVIRHMAIIIRHEYLHHCLHQAGIESKFHHNLLDGLEASEGYIASTPEK